MSFLKTITAAVAGIIFLFSFGAQAQGFYAKLGGGYNVGIGGPYQHNVVRTMYTDQSNSPSLSQELGRENYGTGIGIGGTLGYNIREHLALELGVNYLMGNKNEVNVGTIIYDANHPNYPEPRYDLITTQTYAQMLLIEPAVVVQGTSDYLNPYARFGLVLGKGKIYDTYLERKAKEVEQTSEFSGGLGFGFQGAFGITLKLTETFNLFTEGTFSNLHYSPKSGEITSRTVDGKDDMFRLSREEINYNFEISSNHNTNNTIIQTPNPHLKRNYTFSSAGLNMGLKFNF